MANLHEAKKSTLFTAPNELGQQNEKSCANVNDNRNLNKLHKNVFKTNWRREFCTAF